MYVSFKVKTTKRSSPRSCLGVTVGERFGRTSVTGYYVAAVRFYPRRRPIEVGCVFSIAKTSDSILGVLAAICDEGLLPHTEQNPVRLAFLADAIEEDDNWRERHPKMRWLLDQLRLAGGVQPVRA